MSTGQFMSITTTTAKNIHASHWDQRRSGNARGFPIADCRLPIAECGARNSECGTVGGGSSGYPSTAQSRTSSGYSFPQYGHVFMPGKSKPRSPVRVEEKVHRSE